MSDIESIINDAISDAALPDETPDPTPTDVTTSDPSPEPAKEPAPEAPEATTPEAKAETPAPVGEAPKVIDDFEKQFGIPAESSPGRANRIPYPRVVKITEKAVKDARAKWEAELAITHAPKLKELETVTAEYAEYKKNVTAFEKQMIESPDKFLDTLSTIPAYKEFFRTIDELYTKVHGPDGKGPAVPEVVPNPEDEMPMPDQKLPDGTMVYSMDGLKARDAWNRAQAKKDALAEVEKTYGPIHKEWSAQQKINSQLPQVRAQITEARTWKLFTENEAEIVAALQHDQRLSLEGAYRRVVLPKLEAQAKELLEKSNVDRGKIREEILKELQQAPRGTSATTTASPATTEKLGPRSTEDIIMDAIKGHKER